MKKIIIILAFLAIFFLGIKAPTDPDFFWHLRYGEEIFKTGQIPYEDRFSFTFEGYRWADSYWLSEVLIFLLVSKTGFFLPVLVFATISAATFLAVGFWARIKPVNIWATASAAFISAIVSGSIFGLRPQTISLALFGLVVIILHQFWRKPNSRLIFLLPLIFIFWVNSHAGFILGLILIWTFWLGEFGRLLWKRFFSGTKFTSPQLSFRQLRSLALSNLLSILATLINPYGLGLWRSVLNDASSAVIKNQIVEWTAPDSHSEVGLLFFTFVLTLAILAYLIRMRVNQTQLFLLSTFYFFALAAVRHVSVFALLATPLLAEELARINWGKIRVPDKKLILILFFLIFSLTYAFQFFPQIHKDTRDIENLALAGNFPYRAVEYLKDYPQKETFNYYSWGGYLIWQLPENKTFIDGRMSGWKKDKHIILNDHDEIIHTRIGFEEIINFWQIKSFLIPVDSPLAQYLKISSAWEKVYEDKIAVIFVRR
ncbi:hypothetical protein HY439_02930 [Candidatus Microgenomates bacterium]|nr:hypothetical protein [Candidatus Microgenomates bacterium]